MRIILAEKTPQIGTQFNRWLKSRSVKLTTTRSAEECLFLAGNFDFDIIILGDTLNDMTGHAALRALRRDKVKTPVMMMVNAFDVETIVNALDAGADDVVGRDLGSDEFTARLHNLMRRFHGHASPRISASGLQVDTAARAVSFGGRTIPLTRMEYEMVELLALRRDKVVTRDEFLTHLYDEENEPHFKVLDVCLCKIRKKVADVGGPVEALETVRGRGYRLRDLNTAAPAAEARRHATKRSRKDDMPRLRPEMAHIAAQEQRAGLV